MTHRATFRMPHDCAGQAWTEAIAVLNVASAELRLQAATLARNVAPGSQYGGGNVTPAGQFRALQDRAAQLDELADWLRDAPSLTTQTVDQWSTSTPPPS